LTTLLLLVVAGVVHLQLEAAVLEVSVLAQDYL
jgi:hypothetical protein